MLALLRVAAAEQERGRAHEHRREHGLWHETAADLLEHDHQFAPAEPRAPVLFGNDDPEPAERRHLAPQLAREAIGVVRIAQSADSLQRGTPAHELARGAREQLLFFREYEVHEIHSVTTPVRASCRSMPFSPAGRARAWR